jgi:hypothetical protein
VNISTSIEERSRRSSLLNYFSLFSSFGTLLCCALPSVLVLLGLGTTVASLLSAMPWLVNLSRHKIWTFSISGVWSARLELCQWIRETLDKESIWDEARSINLSRW